MGSNLLLSSIMHIYKTKITTHHNRKLEEDDDDVGHW